MAAKISDSELGDALLESIEHGSFPRSEDAASTPVSTKALPQLVEVVNKARENTKNQIRQFSREASSDVDGWIVQARKLQDDIQRSQATAKEIVEQAELSKENTERVQDAASKVSFLYSEIGYNETLMQVVQQLQDISALLESSQSAIVQGHILHALERLEDAESALTRLGEFESTRVVDLIKARCGELRSALVETVSESWNELIAVDKSKKKITLKHETEREATVHINTVMDALTKLGFVDTFISRLAHDIDEVIISPRLVIGASKVVSALDIEAEVVQVIGDVGDMSVKAALEDIQAIADYLSTRLSSTIAVPLSQNLVPIIASRLISNWLLPAVPLSTNGILEFQEILSLVLGLVESFDELNWSGQSRLSEWVDRSAEIWLAKQKEGAIAHVQRTFPKRVQEKKTVERVETQILSKGDAMLGKQEEQVDDWGADWDEEESIAKEPPPAGDTEEEDMSAWGLDEEELQDGQKEPKTEPEDQTDDDTEDWGAEWGDDEESKASIAKFPTEPGVNIEDSSKMVSSEKAGANREVTLRETYTVTAVPDSVIQIIVEVLEDVYTLNSPELIKSAIAPASGGLYIIPTLLLAMYRATAAIYYSRHDAADMLIYNDCTRLSDRLRTLLQEQNSRESSTSLPQALHPSERLQPRLRQDISLIEGFGKRAYGREMESQRTIIRDHLDAAQGFAGCTNMPFASECDNAIMMTIDRVADVKNQWKPILSHSALLQSLGSLVSTALTKFISDIEDMPDIAEDESRKLSGYCKSLSSLSSHFQTDDGTGETRDMTSIYTPNWFKFQYLGEILDSSLADIKYFWVDGELKLEMDAEEVVDLIKALFAESEHRRKAIADIRNN